MAGETRRGKRTEHPFAAAAVTREEFNKLVDDVELVRAALVTHGGVAHEAVVLAAGALLAGKVDGV